MDLRKCFRGDEGVKCIKCNSVTKSEKYTISALSFFELEGGNYYICERCIFEALTGMYRDWKKELKPFIDEGASSQDKEA